MALPPVEAQAHPKVGEEEEDEEALPTDADCEEMTVAELRDVCAALGVTPVKGVKAALLADVKTHLAKARLLPPPAAPAVLAGVVKEDGLAKEKGRACGACGLGHAEGACPVGNTQAAAALLTATATTAAGMQLVTTHVLDADSVASARFGKALAGVLGSAEAVRPSQALVDALEGKVLLVGADAVTAVEKVSRRWDRAERVLVGEACAATSPALQGRLCHAMAWKLLVPAALAFLGAEARAVGVTADYESLEAAALDPAAFTRAREIAAAAKVLSSGNRARGRSRSRSRSPDERDRQRRRDPRGGRRDDGGRGRGGRGGRGAKPFAGRCFKCGKTGHREQDCN